MLQTRLLRQLFVRGSADASHPAHLSAASGLTRMGSRFHVLADDELSLAVFDLDSGAPGDLFRLFDGELPAAHDARKAAKPDLEALTRLPAFENFQGGALLAVGSGSRANRCRGVLMALDDDGCIVGGSRVVDLSPLFDPLRSRFAQLNIEGAFVTADSLCLLQRGNSGSPVNACIGFDWPAVATWLRGASPAPQARFITEIELGDMAGVPLSFTDGAAMPDGGWVFCAAAEDTSDSYADGACAGSVVGVVSAAGALQCIEPLSLRCKTEGIVVSVDGDMLELLLVTDADDRTVAASLLAASLRRPRP